MNHVSGSGTLSVPFLVTGDALYMRVVLLGIKDAAHDNWISSRTDWPTWETLASNPPSRPSTLLTHSANSSGDNWRKIGSSYTSASNVYWTWIDPPTEGTSLIGNYDPANIAVPRMSGIYTLDALFGLRVLSAVYSQMGSRVFYYRKMYLSDLIAI